MQVMVTPRGAGRVVHDGYHWHPGCTVVEGDEVLVKIEARGDHRFVGWAGDVPEGSEYDMPLRVRPHRRRKLVARFEPAEPDRPPLEVDSGFDSGNIILRAAYNARRRIVADPRQQKGSVNIWWHFRLGGIEPGEFITLDLHYDTIAGHAHPVYSYDGETWHRFSGARPPFVQRFTEREVFIARNIPYAYSRMRHLTQDCRQSGVSELEISDLAASEGGRRVKLLRFGPEPGPGRPIFWLDARQHAFESHASWVAAYLARWLSSEDEAAARLRRKATIFIVPMVDVDTVFHGGAGKSQITDDGDAADMNRDWGPEPRWEVTRRTLAQLRSLREHGPLLGYISIHSPWFYNEAQIYGVRENEDRIRHFSELFSDQVAQVGAENSWRGFRWHWSSIDDASGLGLPHRVAPGRYPSSRTWMARNGMVDLQQGIVTTLEIPHWLDPDGRFISKDGLRGYGEALGRSLLQWVEEVR